jgi:hypothetical protein
MYFLQLSKSIRYSIASLLVLILILTNIMSTVHILTAHADEAPICTDNEKKAHFHSLDHDLIQCNLCDFISSLVFVANKVTAKDLNKRLDFTADYTYSTTTEVVSYSFIHLRGPPSFYIS